MQAFRDGSLITPTDTLWIVGGAQIYAATLSLLDELFLTFISSKHTGDTFFPPFEDDFILADSEDSSPELSFRRYERKK